MTATLIPLAWQSTWFTLAVWGMCRFTPRVSPVTRCTLWWLTSAQMLIAVPAAWLAMPLPQGPVSAILLGLWCAGLGVRLLILGLQGRRARRLVRGALPLPPCVALERLTHLAACLGLRRLPAVRVSASLKSPVLVGLWRPVLLLPVSAVEDTERLAFRMAAAHELAHLRRRDLGFSLAPVLAQSLLWWHPCVWLAVREYTLAREEACDAEARHVTGSAPDEYGAMLLDYLTPVSRPARLVRSVGLPYRSLLRRLNAMRIPYEQPRQGPVGAFCSVCILVTAALVAYPLLPPTTPTARVAVMPRQPVPAALAPSETEIHPVPKPSPAKSLVIAAVPRRRLLRPARIAAYRRVAPVRPLTRITSAVRSRPAPAAVPARTLIAHPVADAMPSPDPVVVVADDAVPSTAQSDAFPDLTQMRSDLQALKPQMNRLQKSLSAQVVSVPQPVLSKDVEEQIKSQFGPQFRQQWRQQAREQRENEMQAARVQIAQARRVAEQAACAEARAFRAQGLADKARRDAMKELMKELQTDSPQIKEGPNTDDTP